MNLASVPAVSARTQASCRRSIGDSEPHGRGSLLRDDDLKVMKGLIHCAVLDQTGGFAGHVASPPAQSSPPPLRRPHLRLVHAEIVRHLVPHRVLHQLRQVLGTLRARRSCGPWKMVMRSGMANGSKTLRLVSGRPS